MSKTKSRATRQSTDPRLNSLRNRLKGALKEALGRKWNEVANFKIIASLRRIELNFSTSLTNSRLNRAVEKIKSLVASFRGATYVPTTQVIHLT